MTALRGIIQRVTCRKGIVGRGCLKQGTVRTVVPLAVRPIAERLTPRLASRIPTLIDSRIAIERGTRKRGES
jgi:hypothetical protein